MRSRTVWVQCAALTIALGVVFFCAAPRTAALAGNGQTGVPLPRSPEGRCRIGIGLLPYDVAVARVYGEIEAMLAGRGQRLADADLQIAATAIYHGLELVTGNVRHFQRVPRSLSQL